MRSARRPRNGEDGFELSLSSRGPVFVRFNQDSSGNDYRVESDRSYPTDGTTWMHVAATYDGSTIKLYLDGQLEASKAASFPLATNQLALSLGAQHDGTRPFLGGMDDVRIYNRALNAEEIATVHAGQPITPPDDPPPPPDDPPPPPDDPPPPADPVNQAPSVMVGADQVTMVNQTLQLAAVVSDDGLPDGSLTFAWSVASGPGDAVWQDDTSASTTVSFVEPGNYVLRMTADDGQLTSNDELTVQVQSEPLVDDGLVGAWQMDSPSGSQVLDASGLGNDGQVVGSPAAISGPVGEALYLHGDGDRVLIADDASLDVQSLTIAAWLQPQERATQYAISKATKNGEDGFELSLSSRGPVFVRFNQDSSGNDYRVESDRSYPTDGTTWMHVAATYDGSTIKLYLDGQLEASKAASFPLATNQLALSLGAQHDGTRPFLGGMDDVRIYNRALNAEEIATVHAGQPITPPDDPPPPPDDPPPPPDDPPPPADPVNQAPSVMVGADQVTMVNQTLQLAAVVSDDGLPDGSLTFAWSVASGPGDAVWQDDTSASTTVSFVEPGNYVLRMTADDGQLTSNDELTVQVQSEPLVDDGLVGAWQMDSPSGSTSAGCFGPGQRRPSGRQSGGHQWSRW